MRFLRMAAMALAVMGGYLGFSGGSVSATPLSAGSLGSGAAAAESPLVEQVQWRYRRRYYRPVRFYRPARYRAARYYRPVRYYRPARRYYRPYRSYRPYRFRSRVVCRVRYTAYGPRRVCFRRF